MIDDDKYLKAKHSRRNSLFKTFSFWFFLLVFLVVFGTFLILIKSDYDVDVNKYNDDQPPVATKIELKLPSMKSKFLKERFEKAEVS